MPVLQRLNRQPDRVTDRVPDRVWIACIRTRTRYLYSPWSSGVVDPKTKLTVTSRANFADWIW